jgi:hypothetical protein
MRASTTVADAPPASWDGLSVVRTGLLVALVVGLAL